MHSNARLNVIVVDSNDSPPEFDRPVYRASISEGAAPGTKVMTGTVSIDFTTPLGM